jgi:[ribosomal protein S18]-alanine N-acetyltransferase
VSLVSLVARPDLLDNVVSIDHRFMRYPWKSNQWHSLDSLDRIYAWLSQDQVIGFALLRLSPLEELAHLLKIALTENSRGFGEGARFWLALEAVLLTAHVRRVYLEVETENQAALRFYERQGFLKLRCMASFYSDGANAWAMDKTL